MLMITSILSITLVAQLVVQLAELDPAESSLRWNADIGQVK